MTEPDLNGSQKRDEDATHAARPDTGLRSHLRDIARSAKSMSMVFFVLLVLIIIGGGCALLLR